MLSKLLPDWTLNNSYTPKCLHTWKRSIKQAYLENGSYEQTLTHLEEELELISVEAPNELQMNTITPKQQTEGNEDEAENINSDTNSSNPNNNKNDRKLETVCLHCGTCGSTNHPAEKYYYGANAANRPLPWNSKPAVQNTPQLQEEQNNITKSVMAAAQVFNWICHVFTPEVDVSDWKLLTS